MYDNYLTAPAPYSFLNMYGALAAVLMVLFVVILLAMAIVTCIAVCMTFVKAGENGGKD